MTRTHRHFALGDNHCSVLSADSDGGDTGARDSLESILCMCKLCLYFSASGTRQNGGSLPTWYS